MATLSMYDGWDGSHTEVIFYVEGLQYMGDQYDKFVFRIFQNGVQITQLEDTDTSWCTARNFTYTISNPSYLGNNWFSPSCAYIAYLDCYYGGNCFTLNPITFTPRAIEPPGGTIQPFVYASVREQTYGTCVANGLACVMDMFRAIATDTTYEKFSAAYIFGSDNRSELDGMYFDEAIDNCVTYGSPRYEIFSGVFPDEVDKATAVSMFNSADNIVRNNARRQRFMNKVNYDFYDTESVADCIREYGCFMFNFRVPNNFYDIGADGIVPQPDTYSGTGHTMVLIGLTTIDNTKYWIAQNSWGEEWGLDGRCFIPYDWGCGVQSPIIYGENEDASLCTSWTCECYAVSPSSYYYEESPTAVYNLAAKQSENSNDSVSLSWDSDETDVNYIILARKEGTTQWYRKTVATGASTVVSVDDFASYEFIIITIKDNHCSSQSSIITINVIGKADLSSITLSRVIRHDEDMLISWDGPDSATGFNIKLTRNYDGYTYIRNDVDFGSYMLEALDDEEWSYGVACTLYIQAYNDVDIGEWVSFGPITTNPKKPTINLSQNNKLISVSYYFEDLTNITQLGFKLYQKSDISGATSTLIHSDSLDIEDDNQNPSGIYELSLQCEAETQYEVQAQAILNLAQTDYDGQTSLRSSISSECRKTITIADVVKPELWTWITAIKSGEIRDFDEQVLYAVNADEWNSFTRKINTMRAYLGIEEYPFTIVRGSSNGYSTSTSFTHAIYNQAVYAIQGMGSGAGNRLNDVDTSYLNVDMFTVLQEELNAAIQNLE